MGHVAQVLPFAGLFGCGDHTVAVSVESGAAQELAGHVRRRFRSLPGAAGTAHSGLQGDVRAEFSEERSGQPIGKNQVSRCCILSSSFVEDGEIVNYISNDTSDKFN